MSEQVQEPLEHKQRNHTQKMQQETRGRGRQRIRPYGPAPQPNPIGRPRTNEYTRPIEPARPVGRPSQAQAQAQAQEHKRWCHLKHK